jgi:hypothetical protein
MYWNYSFAKLQLTRIRGQSRRDFRLKEVYHLPSFEMGGMKMNYNSHSFLDKYEFVGSTKIISQNKEFPQMYDIVRRKRLRSEIEKENTSNLTISELIDFFESRAGEVKPKQQESQDVVETVYLRPVMDFPIKMSMSLIKNVHLFGNFIVFANGMNVVIIDFNPRVKKIRRLARLTIKIVEEGNERNQWFGRRAV